MKKNKKPIVVNNGRYRIDDLYLKGQKRFNLEMVKWLCENKKLNKYSRFFKTRLSTTNNLCYPGRNFLEKQSLKFENIKEVDADISNFFNELASKQEPLGEEFEKVLFDNLWDLYKMD
jgi:hypothetical protein